MSKKTTKSKSKKTYKKKFKGVKYIALKLNKYFKKKYPKYTDALPKAREIFEGFKDNGQKVTVKNIFEVTRKKQLRPFKKKVVQPTEAPELPAELSELTHYFDLTNYPSLFIVAPDNLFFRSTISPEGLDDIQGGTEIDETQVYEDYFRDFVNYINRLKSITDPALKIYEQEWFVKCTEPEFDKEIGRWISFIISTDSEGNSDETLANYGFDPQQPDKLPDEELLGLPSRVEGETSDKRLSGAKKSGTEAIGTPAQELELKISRQKTKEAEAKAKVLEKEAKLKELQVEDKKLDIEAVKLGLMTKEEYRRKWS